MNPWTEGLHNICDIWIKKIVTINTIFEVILRDLESLGNKKIKEIFISNKSEKSGKP